MKTPPSWAARIRSGWDGRHALRSRGRAALYTLHSVALIVLGYVFFVIFINGEGGSPCRLHKARQPAPAAAAALFVILTDGLTGVYGPEEEEFGEARRAGADESFNRFL